MKLVLLLLLTLAACADEHFPLPPPAQGPPPVRVYREVTIRDNYFNPVPLTITVGTRVFFTNKGVDIHSIVFEPPISFYSGSLTPNSSVQRQFNAVGVFRYRCEIHPQMKGTIDVRTQLPGPQPLT